MLLQIVLSVEKKEQSVLDFSIQLKWELKLQNGQKSTKKVFTFSFVDQNDYFLLIKLNSSVNSLCSEVNSEDLW